MPSVRFDFSATPPLGLYVHIPWCVRKCPYCDFNSHQARDAIPDARYLEALLADLEQEAAGERRVETVFIGGGTPSLFSPSLIGRLIEHLALDGEAEISLEANPGTVDQGRFAEFRAAGVNRLSIGVQSFDEGLLGRIGRIHGRREALAAVEAARKAGFDNINLDLMFGLPGQSPAQALADVDTAIALAPAHISYYQLTIEPNTLFHHRPPVLPREEHLWAMHTEAQARLAAAGYGQYEVSAYAREGRRCRHNLNYWHFGDYLGIGAGAHGKLTDTGARAVTRTWKLRHPGDYLANALGPGRIGGRATLSPADAALEFMMNALRLTEGFETGLFSARTGLPLDQVRQTLDEARDRGLLHWDDTSIRPTEKGRDFLNELLAMFLTGEEGPAHE